MSRRAGWRSVLVVVLLGAQGCGATSSRSVAAGAAAHAAVAGKRHVKLVVERPRSGAVTRRSSIVVSGRATTRSRVSLAGRAVRARRGRFHIRVHLRVGRNVVRVVARMAARHAKRVRVVIRRRRAAPVPVATALPTPTPTPTPTAPACDPNYAGACLNPNSPDYDCAGGSGDGPDYTGPVQVVGDDRYGLDRDGDGYACE
jgi:Glucodextranase, domain B